MDPSFWRNRRVFVTGHTGFKGSWMCLMLQNYGAVVSGFALPPATNPNLFDIAGIGTGVTTTFDDVRNLPGLRSALQQAQPEVVMHMAAQALVRLSYANPVSTFETNVMGTVNVLEAARQVASVRAVVNVTSDKCYENREWVWGYRENEAMGGYDPYSSSKGCSELVTAAYRNSFFGLPGTSHAAAIASARGGNVIGGGDWSADRLVPDIMRAITEGRPVLIRNPGAIRPWQHVLEPLTGYLALAERLVTDGKAYAEGWNFGPRDHDAVPVLDLVKRLAASWGGNASWTIDPAAASQPHEAHYLRLDCSKAANRLGWHPRWTLSETLDSIVSFYKVLAAGGDVRSEMTSQIELYGSGAR